MKLETISKVLELHSHQCTHRVNQDTGEQWVEVAEPNAWQEKIELKKFGKETTMQELRAWLGY